MPRAKGQKNTKRFEKSVKDIVKKELSEELEEKHAITEYSSVLINRNIPSGVVLNGQGNFFKILPEISQSTTGGAGRAYNERIGNEINLKSISINGILNYADANVTQIDLPDQKIALRVMILRAKEVNDQELLFDNMPTDSLLRFGFQTGSSGPTAFNGNALDPWREINRDVFSVRYDKVFYLDAPLAQPGLTDVDLAFVPSRSRIFRHKLTFGKNGLKLKYSTSADDMANNFPYFMVMGYSSCSSQTQPSNNLARVTLSCVGSYTDA